MYTLYDACCAELKKSILSYNSYMFAVESIDCPCQSMCIDKDALAVQLIHFDVPFGSDWKSKLFEQNERK